MDKIILQKVCELQSQGEKLALIMIINTKGSTPRKIGSAMIVERNGKIWGTVGGGCCEAEVRQRALVAMDEGISCIYQATLLNDVAANEGMVCGGIMDFFIQVL
ncbi:XdhC family protein [Pelosinus sp. sgz500959]|uniref:XdhC family protein n=1 Tax=Pelosinus sp. sgz500959 TaxID=3242472 RepID=UPI00366C7E20